MASLMPDKRYVIGVDVGTGSARAGIFDLDGNLVASAKKDISLHRAPGGHVEQSSAEIWQAVCATVRQAIDTAGVAAKDIVGIGFDATCSLVVIGDDDTGLPVGDADRPDRDIIVWMDHRAIDQAQRINATGHDVLRYVGGVISPEMEMPKLLWLKENRRAVFDAAHHFFDLTDFLTWKATGSLARSSCTVTCKWNYVGHENRWDLDYLRLIGLGELAADISSIGENVVTPGAALANGLTQDAADALGLAAGTPVAAGLIDAHAGGIGTVGAIGEVTENLAYVFGTSSCTMTTTQQPVFVPGVWGPYYSAMVPGLWLNEGGQSAAGAAIDHLLKLHPARDDAASAARSKGLSLPDFLGRKALEAIGGKPLSHLADLARGLHVVPEFIGNRAPYADPQARAIIAGLGMDDNVESLVALYVAGLCGLGYGLRQIVETQARHGAAIERIVISGGAGQSPVARRIIADTVGKPVATVVSQEPVLLGSAILGAVAARCFDDIASAMRAMSSMDSLVEPAGGDIVERHDRRYVAFQALQAAGREFRNC
ncbi:ribulokinase [Aliihoeflea aestuarii]|jgi:D-ribulokinase|uniref:FGGY-family carbohydrate kinase n=1 Tax=Aliihoeflea aestuarii TaxID=453840 RepID=UPI002092E3E5|nr:FGGY-family carbohydrate kinase [Aliihoeflea aestuarii]MCO6390947.1 ribulokinase [Aliihoeflea aestuarii]